VIVTVRLSVYLSVCQSVCEQDSSRTR